MGDANFAGTGRPLEELEADAESVRQALRLPGTARKTSMRRRRLRELEQQIAAKKGEPACP